MLLLNIEITVSNFKLPLFSPKLALHTTNTYLFLKEAVLAEQVSVIKKK